jgi:hypothetical protein
MDDLLIEDKDDDNNIDKDDEKKKDRDDRKHLITLTIMSGDVDIASVVLRSVTSSLASTVNNLQYVVSAEDCVRCIGLPNALAANTTVEGANFCKSDVTAPLLVNCYNKPQYQPVYLTTKLTYRVPDALTGMLYFGLVYGGSDEQSSVQVSLNGILGVFGGVLVPPLQDGVALGSTVADFSVDLRSFSSPLFVTIEVVRGTHNHSPSLS